MNVTIGKCGEPSLLLSLHPRRRSATMAAVSASVAKLTLASSSQKQLSRISFRSSNLWIPTTHLTKSPFQSLSISSSSSPPLSPLRATTDPTPTPTLTPATTFHGLCYVLGDNIDTDQIIPAEYLTLVPSKPDEYRKLGSFALVGLPASHTTRFIHPGQTQTQYSILIGGQNFGCGSSREHAPVALGAAGVKAVVAESYARIFFRNSVATGEIYPLESEARLCDECSTGDVITIELDENRLINHTTGKEYKLKPIGDAGPVIDAGGIFAYARNTGMIASTRPT